MHPRLYIAQLLGIVLLLCGYFLTDQPDSLSVMHFDATSPSVICATHKAHLPLKPGQTSVAGQDNTKHKTNVPKYISFETVMPAIVYSPVYCFSTVTYTPALPEIYSYLFYEEINPPPPRCC